MYDDLSEYLTTKYRKTISGMSQLYGRVWDDLVKDMEVLGILTTDDRDDQIRMERMVDDFMMRTGPNRRKKMLRMMGV